MEILSWTLLVFINGINAVIAYKKENYKTAMLTSFACGWSAVFLMYCF